jgi:hypothetical protein
LARVDDRISVRRCFRARALDAAQQRHREPDDQSPSHHPLPRHVTMLPRRARGEN